MIILDTDHLSVLTVPGGTSFQNLASRMNAAVGEAFATSIITVEEIMRGWMAVIGRERRVHRQIHAYTRLRQLFDFVANWSVVPFNDAAADEFERIRDAGTRISTSDLKIASIALVNDALLLTANRKDFEKVPGLRFEDWLH